MGGLSILPHGNFPIIETLIRIFLQRKDPDRIVDLLTSQLKRDEGQRIWSALLRWFAYIRPTDLSKLATLIDTLFKRYPNLSTTREAAMMLTHSLWTVPDLVRAIVADWKAAEAPLVRQAYGELIALAALIRPELDWPKPMLSDIISEGTEDERVGVAYAAVNVWSDRESRSAAASSQILQQLAPIATPKIWHAILDLFRLVDEIEPDENWTPLLSILADNLKGASSRVHLHRGSSSNAITASSSTGWQDRHGPRRKVAQRSRGYPDWDVCSRSRFCRHSGDASSAWTQHSQHRHNSF